MTKVNKDIEQEGDVHFEGGGEKLLGKVQVDEDPTKCCFCIPIEIGIIILGIGIIANAVQLVLAVLSYLSVDLVQAIVTGVLIVPLLVAAFYFVQYFRDREDKDNRGNLAVGCVYAAITCLAQAVWYFLMTIIYGTELSVVLNQVISAAITFLIFAYCYGVCKRYADQ